LAAGVAALATTGCGGGSRRGASDIFDGSSVENQPVAAWSVYGDPTIFNEALVEELRSCSVGGDLGEYVDEIVAQGGPNTIEQQEYEGGEVVASRVLTVGDVRGPVTGLTLPEPYEFLYKITCRGG
jgi:hypothetical protein